MNTFDHLPGFFQMPGFLIAFEGIDGAGKTTQCHFLQETLQSRKLAAIRTKEPTTGQWGQILRDSALTGRLSAEEEIETFIKDRKEHVSTLIEPALESGKIVIVDRYYFSTAAYQGARGKNPLDLLALNETFAPEPDMLVLIDVSPEVGLNRVRMRGDRANHFEKTGTLEKCREIFLSIKKPYTLLIDGNKSPEEIRQEILLSFNARYTEAIARAAATPEEKLNATLRVFGAAPISR